MVLLSDRVALVHAKNIILYYSVFLPAAVFSDTEERTSYVESIHKLLNKHLIFQVNTTEEVLIILGIHT